ncbi:hypothetical protein IFM89_018064 [Coptis chinensis]|uniref:Protein-serine/threonine phosphatase n=1 Tax=Coptis chinensis TaxID=261450 RepID=A0A835IAL4_9MAGN|nr:hypothetical protein IFM89_018064 [Coptis chinensis]
MFNLVMVLFNLPTLALNVDYINQKEAKPTDSTPDATIECSDLQFVPSVLLPNSSAFFGVFDGHGGPDAAAYMKENAIKIFFKDADFLQTMKF